MVKKILGVLLGLIVLMILGLTFYLLPAHLQIRTAHPPLPPAASLRTLTESADKPVRVSAILTSSQSGPVASIGHHSVVVEWADGRIFLIDAGMDEANSIEFGQLMETLMRSDPAEFHSGVFDALADRSARVKGVGFTHLHIDHVQGIEAACAGAPPFVVVQSVRQRKLHNLHTEEGAAIVQRCPAAESVSADSPVELDGFPGLALLSLGGHTPGSTLFAVALGERILLFPGDITNSKQDLVDDAGKGFFYSYLVVPEDTDRTRELRAWLRALAEEPDMSVYVSHDLEDMSALNTGG